MKLDEKISNAVLDLLSNGESVNISSLARRIGVTRQRIYQRIYKYRGVV